MCWPRNVNKFLEDIYKLFMVTLGLAFKATSTNWFLESSAINHMTSHHAWFITYGPLDLRNTMYLENNSHHQIRGKGKVAIWLMINDVKIIQEVYDFSVLCHNVISIK